jgi:hypothetical protein
MKKLTVFLAALMMGLGFQVKAQSKIKFDKEIYERGKIVEGKYDTTEVKITNLSKETHVIVGCFGRFTCACMDAIYPKDNYGMIKPQETKTVYVVYTTKGRPGPFNRSFRFSVGGFEKTLCIKGEVVPLTADEMENVFAFIKEGEKAHNNKDYAKAKEWYQKAADKGNTDVIHKINELNVLIAQPWRDKYDDVSRSQENYIVSKNGKKGMVNKNGKEIIPPKYDDIHDFSESFASVKLNGKWGFINENDRIVIDIKYDKAYFFKNGMADVEINGKTGIIDKRGNYIIQPKYDDINGFSEDGFAEVTLNGKWGLINRNGDIVVDIKYDDIRKFENGYARVVLNGKCGFVNQSGRLVIPCQYTGAEDFEYTLFDDGTRKFCALVLKSNGTLVYINTNNEEIGSRK